MVVLRDEAKCFSNQKYVSISNKWEQNKKRMNSKSQAFQFCEFQIEEKRNAVYSSKKEWEEITGKWMKR